MVVAPRAAPARVDRARRAATKVLSFEAFAFRLA